MTQIHIDSTTSTYITDLAEQISATNIRNGFWRKDIDHHVQLAVKLGLVTAEVAEAMEVNRLDPATPEEPIYRAGMTPSQLDDFTEELADVVIRVLDIAGYYNLPIGEVILTKIEKNKNRPFRHSKRY